MRTAERLLAAMALSAAASPAALPARGDGTFEAPFRIPVPTAVSVAAGDFNRDGKLDLAVVNGRGSVLVFIQDTVDPETWRQAAPVQAGTAGFFLRAADLDLDGDDDLVLADPGTVAYILRSKGEGSFEISALLTQSPNARWVAVGDWNRDGKPDIASANPRAGTLSIYQGAGDGTADFLRHHTPGGEPHAVEALDYDLDGRLDLVVGLDLAGVVPMGGNGDGSFEARAPLLGSVGCYRYLAVADFNQDGRGDLVTDCHVWISAGNGSFLRTMDFVSTSSAIADLNWDGRPDLALASQAAGGGIEVHPGDGNGGFQRPVSFEQAGVPTLLASRDLDGDQRADLIVGDVSGLTVLAGTPGDRFLTSGLSVKGFTSAQTVAVADVDRDGAPDLLLPNSTVPGIQAYLGPVAAARDSPSRVLATGQKYTSMEAADLDGDGVMDLAGTDKIGGTVLVSLLEADGRVRSEGAMAACRFPLSLAAGFLDRDSTLDLVAACLASSDLAVFLGRGGGAFQEARLVPTIANPSHVAIGLLDPDDRPDLAVVSGSEAAIHHGTGGGDFSPALVLIDDGGRFHTDVATGDADGDGLQDVLVSEILPASIILYRGRGGAAPGDPLALKLSHAPSSLVLADLDADGLLDLTAASSSSKVASVIRNRGSRGFGEPIDYALGIPAVEHRIADLDGDGALDLAAVSSSGSAAVVLRGRPVPAAASFRRGDVDGNGRLQVTDPIALIDRLFLGQAPLACEDAADADDDGKLNLTDPVLLLDRLLFGGAPLPPPGPEGCGEDPSADLLPGCHARC